TITITSGSNILSLTNNASIAASTATFVGQGAAGKTLTLVNNTQTLTLTDVSSGSNACSSATAGTYVNNASTTTEATNLAAAINSCHTSFPTVGFTASASGSGVTVTGTGLGAATFGGTETSGGGHALNWSATSAGSNGTNACASSTTGTFASSLNTTTLASNLAAAINLCPVGAGVTATSSTNTVTVTSRTAGDSSISAFTVAASNNTGIYTCDSSTAGTNGTNARSSTT